MSHIVQTWPVTVGDAAQTDLPGQRIESSITRPAIQAIAPPLIINNDAPGSPAPIGATPPGQQSGNVGGTESPDTALGSVGQYPSMSAPKTAPSIRPGIPLTSQSHGAVGMKGTAVSSTKETSVITSSKQNVHLDSGTQLMLQTE